MNPWNHLKRSLQSERGSWVITAVVLTTASAGMSFMSAFAAGKNAKNQTQAVADQAKRNADLKARSTVRLAATQRMSFLQSGISLTGENDTAQAVQDETYKYGMEDISQIGKNAVQTNANIMAKARSEELQSISSGIMTLAGGAGKLNTGGV